jgi:hypothetical protein
MTDGVLVATDGVSLHQELLIPPAPASLLLARNPRHTHSCTGFGAVWWGFESFSKTFISGPKAERTFLEVVVCDSHIRRGRGAKQYQSNVGNWSQKIWVHTGTRSVAPSL